MTRTATGYRTYGEVHLQSALAYRGLAAGVGPVEAKKIVRAFHQCPASQALALLDSAHARLDTERADLRQAKEAARAISSCPRTAGVPTRASMSPWKMCRSVPQIPTYAGASSTSPGPGERVSAGAVSRVRAAV
ncbi:hypothetical protein QFZ49_006709 [Streptomyces turgidiscabies]|uniref:MerR family transcriptional regulator n=1 Tax=Streptomyces turgidiscabies TaxID=85558 RepID=A0ABU0RXN1_9ACTN|nr:hypothetical protein [Streptomyces turgidiscabies]